MRATSQAAALNPAGRISNRECWERRLANLFGTSAPPPFFRVSSNRLSAFAFAEAS